MSVWLTCCVWGALSIVTITMLVVLLKTRKPFSSLLRSASQGICAMLAVNLVGIASGVSIGFGWFSMLFASLLGIPGVITMLLMELI